MSTYRKRISRKIKQRAATLTNSNLYQLLFGFELIKPSVDHDNLPDLWEEHKAWIMEWWVSTNPGPIEGYEGCVQPWKIEKLLNEHELGPGTRPWAWWNYDAPKDRRIIARGKLPQNVNWETCGKGYRYWGKPSGMGGPGGERPIFFESVYVYLKRHKLLMAHDKNLDLPIEEKWG